MEENYLSRPLIDGISYEISDTHIAIQCSSTCYINCTRPSRMDKDALLRRYRNVLAMAKAQGVRIKYTRHIRKTIQQLWPAYEADFAEREKLFDQLLELAWQVKARGIHWGTVDDEVLSTIAKVSNQLAAYGYGGTPTSGIADISSFLSSHERSLSRVNDPCSMIVL